MTQNPSLALVLGGGAAAGNAWLIGLVAGLADGGLDLSTAGLTIGTSAGATAAAQLGSGIPPAQLADAILAEQHRAGPPPGAGPRPGANPGARPAPAIPIADVFDRWRGIGADATSGDDLQRRMGAYGLECDPLLAAEAAPRRAVVAQRLPVPDWPDRPIAITVMDAETGELVLLTRDSGAALVDAVLASTTMPGMLPSVPIAGRRFFDGGVRSSENADAAAGFDRVVVLAPLGDRGAERPRGAFEGLRREDAWGTTLASQVELLRAGGSRVDVLVPDAASREATGADRMDLAVRAPTARAAREQGRRAAAGLLG
jgi:NTE family protein